MKNYKFLVPILLVALLGGSVYKTYSDREKINKQYDNDITQARQNRKLEVYVNAEEDYLDALKLKDSAKLRAELGEMYIEAEDLRTAAKWGESLISEYPKEQVGYEFLIQVYLEQKDYASCFRIKDEADGLKISSKKIEEIISDIKYEYYLEGEYAQVEEFSNGYAAVKKRFVKTKVDKAQTDSGNTNPDNTNPDNTNSDNTDSGNTNPGKAAIAEDDRYNSAEKTYTTTIKPYAYDDFRKYCEIVGTSNTASDGKIWYSEVTGIKAKDGYKIKDSDGSFVEEIAIDANGITQGENQFALVIGQEKKNSENETLSYINEGTVSGAYNYDSVKPTLSIAKDNDADWINKDVEITASPSDAGSQIAAVKYTVTDEKDKSLLEETTVNPNADGSYLITLQASKFANKEIKVNVIAYDNAGLRSDTQTKIIKFDTELPKAELSLNSNEGEYYFTDKISVGISATDNFSGIAGIKAVYLTDDVTSASGWDIKNIDWDAENVQNLKADAKSVTISFTDTTNAGNVYVKVTDKAGNEKITSLSDDKKFHFDKTAPTVAIAYSSADENTTNDNYSQLKDGVEYYNHDRYAQITVTDASFNKNATQIKVAVDNKKAVNILDNKAEVQGAAIVKTDDEIWTDNKDGSYTAKLKFTGNHLYKIEASSTDLAGNKTEEGTVADSKSKEFYIDELAPVGKVQFSTDKTDAGIIGNWWCYIHCYCAGQYFRN